MTDLVRRFGISVARVGILEGLLNYRQALAEVGINEGFQIINGSFSEDIEQTEAREPKDIDIVTFAYRPPQVKSLPEWQGFISGNWALFEPRSLKARYFCDAYYIDLEQPPELLVDITGYWYGLFSHRRNGMWKGMLRIPLQSDDASASQMLAGP